MKKLLIISLFSCSAFATVYQPNTSQFTCPDGEIVDGAKQIQVSVGERPGGIGTCFWGKPVVSFNISQDRTTVTGYTTWTLDGGFIADGCSDVKGEKMTSIGVIAKMNCKTQQM